MFNKYTVDIKTICEALYGIKQPVSYPSVADMISTVRGQIFDFEYPIFDELYKPVLETKILKHFFTRELCCETYGEWKLRIDTKMNEIMPYYNQLYKSELLEINPLYTSNFEKTHQDSGGDNRSVAESGNNADTETRSSSGSGSNTGNSINSGSGTRENDNSQGETFQTKDVVTSKSKSTENGTNKGETSSTNLSKYSETPQGTVKNVQNGTYLTNARQDENNGSSSNTNTTNASNENTTESANKHLTTGESIGKENTSYSDQSDTSSEYSKEESNKTDKTGDYSKNVTDTITTTRAYVEKVAGNTNKSESSLLLEYRDTFLNIDMMIIDELETLFFGLW